MALLTSCDHFFSLMRLFHLAAKISHCLVFAPTDPGSLRFFLYSQVFLDCFHTQSQVLFLASSSLVLLFSSSSMALDIISLLLMVLKWVFPVQTSFLSSRFICLPSYWTFQIAKRYIKPNMPNVFLMSPRYLLPMFIFHPS